MEELGGVAGPQAASATPSTRRGGRATGAIGRQHTRVLELEAMSGKFRISYNAPIVLTFALLSTFVLILNQYISERSTLWFVAWPELVDARSYLGLVTHVLGHSNWDHLLGNFSMILLLGPLLEERNGSGRLLMMIVVTALVTGLLQLLLGSGFLHGASGIVFMMILLASMANIRQREIPLTFIAVVILFIGREVVAAFKADQVSQMAHIIGGAVGAGFGFLGAGPPTPPTQAETVKAAAAAKVAAAKAATPTSRARPT
jgi:membrane associated rhomboid family serine protease